MELTIRRAEREDCPGMFELVQALARYEKAAQEVTISLEEFTESGFGREPAYWAFVAEAGKKIIGFALYYVRYSTWKGRRMYLEDILVTEEWRGKGAGQLLFNRLIAEAREKKLNGITWQVLNWNEPAIRFYKKYQAAFDGEWLNCSIPV